MVRLDLDRSSGASDSEGQGEWGKMLALYEKTALDPYSTTLHSETKGLKNRARPRGIKKTGLGSNSSQSCSCGHVPKNWMVS